MNLEKDKYFNKYLILKTEDSALYKQVRGIVYTDTNKPLLISKYGYFKNYYTDGITFSEFGNNALCFLGKGDINEGINKNKSYIHDFINKTNLNRLSSDYELLYDIIIAIIFLEKYIGFHCEYILKTIINSTERFIVVEHDAETDKHYEKYYASDMIVYDKISKNFISIQCKQHTFINQKYNMSNYTKRNNLLLEEKGILTYYCFFNDTNILPWIVNFTPTAFIPLEELLLPFHPLEDDRVISIKQNELVENSLKEIFDKLPRAKQEMPSSFLLNFRRNTNER